MVNAPILSKSTQSYANYFLRCDITRDADRVKDATRLAILGPINLNCRPQTLTIK